MLGYLSIRPEQVIAIFSTSSERFGLGDKSFPFCIVN